MKSIITIIVTFISVCTFKSIHSQTADFEREYADVRQSLNNWDAVRGEWLANSMLAMAKNEEIPQRIFPEDFTPYEMLSKVPSNEREKIKTTSNNGRTNPTSTQSHQIWSFIFDFISRSQCPTVNGRSYGDPHFNSFDGNSFSLQSVGEFTLAKTKDGYVNVQARQTANSDDFSLNTAVALNVGGDRVCFYAGEKPDSDISSPIRLNGRSIRVVSDTYLLPHGGTIRSQGNDYIVTWPTGEKVSLRMGSFQRMNVMNITSQIFPCVTGGYEGLLGNANGNSRDDLMAKGDANPQPDLYESMSRFGTVFGSGTISDAQNRAEKDYLDRLTRDFGNSWRINDLTTLFDYAPGYNTASFTDYTFPRVHRTVGDLSNKQRQRAEKVCRDQGIRDEDIKGCVFDNAYLEIPPSPRPKIEDPTKDVVLKPVEKPSRPNPIDGRVNNGENNKPLPTIDRQMDEKVNKEPLQNERPNAQPIEKKPENTTRDNLKIERKPVNIPSEPIKKPEINIFKNENKTNQPSSNPNPPIFNKPSVEKKEPAKVSTPIPSKPSNPDPASTPSIPKSGGVLKKGG